MKKINETKNSKKANATINKVFEEMKYAESYLNKLNVTWYESYEDIYSMDIYYLRRLDHRKVHELEKKYHNQYLLVDRNVDTRSGQPLKKVILYDEEDNIYNCEFGIIKWNSFAKIDRNIKFKNNGDILYTQKSSSKKSTKIDYDANYNVNQLDLTITFKIDKDILKYNRTNSIQKITYNNITIENNLTTGIQTLTYQNKQNNQDIYYEIIIDKNNIINKKLKLTNYDFNNNIDNIVEFNFNKANLTNAVYTKDNQEVDMLNNEIISEFTNSLLEKIYNNNQTLNNLNNNPEEIINTIKDNLFIIIKQIKGDTPLQGLSKRLDIVLSMIYAKKEDDKLEITKSKKKKQRR